MLYYFYIIRTDRSDKHDKHIRVTMKFKKKKMLPLLINIMPRTHYCGIHFFYFNRNDSCRSFKGIVMYCLILGKLKVTYFYSINMCIIFFSDGNILWMFKSYDSLLFIYSLLQTFIYCIYILL